MVTHRARSARTRRLATWTRATVAVLVVFLLPAARTGFAHPLHTTLTRLSYDAATRTLNVSVRVFADDFGDAVIGRERADVRAAPSDSATLRYLTGRLALQRAGGGAIALQWCGMRRDGETLLLCLRAVGQPSPAGVRMRNALLGEKFADQVNIVQASYGGATRTLLFTPRDSIRVLP